MNCMFLRANGVGLEVVSWGSLVMPSGDMNSTRRPRVAQDKAWSNSTEVFPLHEVFKSIISDRWSMPAYHDAGPLIQTLLLVGICMTTRYTGLPVVRVARKNNGKRNR